jgi:hypothetical protein
MMGAEMYYYLIGLAFLGAVLSAAGGWGASYVARTAAEADAAVATARLESDKAELNAKLEKFETALNQNTEQVFRAMTLSHACVHACVVSFNSVRLWILVAREMASDLWPAVRLQAAP